MEGRWIISRVEKHAELRLRLRLRRLIRGKTSNRAAVHGTKRPVTEAINREEAETEINKGKEEKDKKRGDAENC